MTAEHSALLRHALAQVAALHGRHEAIAGDAAAAGAQAEADLRISRHARFVRTGATRALGTAGDHLVAFRRLSEHGPLLPFAPMTLLRASIEAADLARWLIDPDVDSMTRVGRGVAVQLEDYEQRRRFELAFGLPEPPAGQGKSAATRKAELLAVRAPDVPEAERVPVVELERATALALVYGPERMRGPIADALPVGDRSWLYRLLSAFAHGKEWALLATDTSRSQPIGEGVHRGVVMAGDAVIVACTVATIEQVAMAMVAVETYLCVGPAGLRR